MVARRGGFRRVFVGGLGSEDAQRITRLHPLAPERVPSARAHGHKRYNVVYHNPEMEPQLAAPTFDEIQTELLEIVGIGVFTNIESATDGV
jgi:hypothetical protein